MFRFEAFDENDFLEFLWQGLFDDFIEEVLKRFELYSPKVQFELILYIRERLKESLYPEILAKALEIKEDDAEHIMKGDGKIFEILIAERDNKGKVTGKICKALAIPQTSKIITNLSHLKSKLSVLKKLLGYNFAVFFESAFSGGSFMLPLAVALSVKKIPEDLRFTGKLNSKGEVLKVDFIKEKLEFAQRHNLRLITPLQIKKFETIKIYLENETWDIPFYVTSASRQEFLDFKNSDSYQGKKNLAEFDILKGIELFYGLSEENFYLVTGKLSTKETWEGFCKEFYDKINLIKNRLPGVKTFHIGIRGAVSFGFALGVLFSHFDPFVFYHYQVVEGIPKYHPIPVFTPRELKERLTKEYELIKPNFEKRGDDLVIILNFSHHEPTADVKRYISENLKEPSFLILETEKKGNLPVEVFFEVARESASFIQEIRKTFSFNSYHFFFSCPIPIAFMVGLAFGHYADGWIYNYEKEEAIYKPVLNFKFLRKIREGSQI